jgi:hypothetical protein
VFLGFCAKEVYWTTAGKEWYDAKWAVGVKEVCSIADCFAARPDGWVDRWDFNAARCYGNVDAALAAAPEHQRAFHVVYAYRALPVLFPRYRAPRPLSVEDIFAGWMRLGPLPPPQSLEGFTRLGYDVAGNASLGWECSPLSCNAMGARFPVNRYCLIDTLPEAYRAAVAFAREQPEPGDYLVIEVLRREPAGA